MSSKPPAPNGKSRKLIDEFRAISKSQADREARRILRDATRLMERCREFAHHHAHCSCAWCQQAESGEATLAISTIGKVIRGMLPDIEPATASEEIVDVMEEQLERMSRAVRRSDGGDNGASARVGCEGVGAGGRETVHELVG